MTGFGYGFSLGTWQGQPSQVDRVVKMRSLVGQSTGLTQAGKTGAGGKGKVQRKAEYLETIFI